MKSQSLFSFVIIAAFVIAPQFSNGIESFGQVLSSYKILHPNTQTMSAIAKKFEVVRRLDDGFEVIVPALEKTQLLAIDSSAILLDDDISEAPFVRDPFKSITVGDYRTLAEVQAEMAKIAQDHPDIAQLVPYGESQQHRQLMALKLSDNVTVDEDEPEIMLTAATHGDEIITTEILMNLLNRLVDNYGKDSRLTALVSGHELYFIPVVNVDGFYNRLRYDNNVDPNRSYPWPRDPNARSTASIAKLIEFFHAHNFVGSLDYHAYGELIMYPWAYIHDPLPPEFSTPFHAVAQSMAETNNYTYGPISDVIYVAEGSSADYYFWKNKTRAFAIEVGTAKQPMPARIPTYTEAQAEPLWRFLESF